MLKRVECCKEFSPPAGYSKAVWVSAVNCLGFVSAKRFCQAILGFTFVVSPLIVDGQSCSGPYCLEHQQMSCPNGTATTITGTVYTPNGKDPLPNVIVYIPNGPLDAFPDRVSCVPPGTPPSGSPLTGTVSIYNGTYTLLDAPSGTNIPIVIQSGRWRRQTRIPMVSPCVQNTFDISMPSKQSATDNIPKFAIVSGSQDRLECVLRQVGVDDSEFSAPGGSGRIQIYGGISSPGALVTPDSPDAKPLMQNLDVLSNYDVLMLACEGSAYEADKTSAMLSNVETFANAGGRIFGSHFSFTWIYKNGTFANAVQWSPNNRQLDDQDGYINITFPDGKTLAQWLALIGASTTYGQIPLKQLKQDTTGVVSPTRAWMTAENAVMQLTFNMPWDKPNAQQCGRVLFSDYHIDPPQNEGGKIFPAECSAGDMTPQEKLLEYNLFYLSGSDIAPYFTPDPASFENTFIGLESAIRTLTWTNSTPFGITVDSVAVDGEFVLKKDNCSTRNIQAGETCTVDVAFKPTGLGERTGAVNLGYKNTFTSGALKGNGVLRITASPASLDFGGASVGAGTANQIVTISNDTAYSIGMNPISATGDFVVHATCSDTLAAHSSCTALVAFMPTTSGTRQGKLVATPANPDFIGASVDLSGVGQDFDISFDPASGDTIAGYGKNARISIHTAGGYTGTLQFSCTTDAAASTCNAETRSARITGTSVIDVGITTTSKYTVIGYGGMGGGAVLTLLGLGSGLLLWVRRRDGQRLGRRLVLVVVLGMMGAGVAGCSGKLPNQNPSYTAPGEYTYTLTATDGFLAHSATYKLKVVASK